MCAAASQCIRKRISKQCWYQSTIVLAIIQSPSTECAISHIYRLRMRVSIWRKIDSSASRPTFRDVRGAI
ncbi:hypothetical protein BDQ12DRAFT_689270 [Crucibulum laeve]|uniref:Uncharacterized protein n=1 Tax=Crucibulum laeve TaxID=68775 RepID=A0A5C3LPU6_9AGAR|nr:hypothetical protein BDQ12DRAFT_689270 [Crucibulum laeve]